MAALVLAAPAWAEAPPPSERVDPAYRVHAAVAAPGRIDFTVEARGRFHLNDDYPLHLDLRPSGQVKVAQARVDRESASLSPCSAGGHACGALLHVPYEGKGPGRLDGTVAVSLCDEERCLIEKVAVGVAVGR